MNFEVVKFFEGRILTPIVDRTCEDELRVFDRGSAGRRAELQVVGMGLEIDFLHNLVSI